MEWTTGKSIVINTRYNITVICLYVMRYESACLMIVSSRIHAAVQKEQHVGRTENTLIYIIIVIHTSRLVPYLLYGLGHIMG